MNDTKMRSFRHELLQAPQSRGKPPCPPLPPKFERQSLAPFRKPFNPTINAPWPTRARSSGAAADFTIMLTDAPTQIDSCSDVSATTYMGHEEITRDCHILAPDYINFVKW